MTCPTCKKPLSETTHAFWEVDAVVIGCKPCGRFAIKGDDRWYLREDLGADIQKALLARAISLIKAEDAKHVRYTDCPPGKMFG